jgi:hypothetical protein
MQAQKSGRTSGYTSRQIIVLNVMMRVHYGDAGTCVFANQLVSDIKSAPGDSGSLVLDMERRAVGLLSAADISITVFDPISDVLEQLQIEFTRE